MLGCVKIVRLSSMDVDGGEDEGSHGGWPAWDVKRAKYRKLVLFKRDETRRACVS